jgi:hypothetical protein
MSVVNGHTAEPGPLAVASHTKISAAGYWLDSSWFQMSQAWSFSQAAGTPWLDDPDAFSAAVTGYLAATTP